jgi:hypothetical protein
MKRKLHHLFLTLALLVGATTQLFAQGTAFTYQGRLNDGGNPANGIYDLRFAICDAVSGGNQIAGPLTNNATVVTNGLFIATLDFGGVFTGTNYWLDISVRTNGSGTFIELLPRQPLTPTPYAIFANTASNLSGTISAAQVSGASPATTGYQSFLCSDGKYRRLSIVQQGGIWTLGVEQAGTVSP